jgi:hypothetical protein
MSMSLLYHGFGLVCYDYVPIFPFDTQKFFPYTAAIQREVLILKTERRVS